jgi:hypothetical protein
VAGHDLESPGGDTPAHWSKLYRSRGDEQVAPQRPTFTGDVFQGTTVISPEGEQQTIDAMIVQHPCALRTNGVDLNQGILMAEVRDFQEVASEKWGGFLKRMPLPDLEAAPEGTRPLHRAAFFDIVHVASSKRLGKRIASMSQFGVNLMLQRWVHHNSRVVVPTVTYNEQTSGVFEEADLVEEWCYELEGVVDPDRATRDAVAWLRQPATAGDDMRQKLLDDPQQRSRIRMDMRAHLRALQEAPN